MTSSTNGHPAATPLHEFVASEEGLEVENEADGAEEGDGLSSPELRKFLAEIKGQAQFLLYLADQIEESLGQLSQENDPCHGAFLCKVLAMYSTHLETKHQGLGEKIAETCQEVYVTVRERELGG
jgi:hypothetical protein